MEDPLSIQGGMIQNARNGGKTTRQRKSLFAVSFGDSFCHRPLGINGPGSVDFALQDFQQWALGNSDFQAHQTRSEMIAFPDSEAFGFRTKPEYQLPERIQLAFQGTIQSP